METLQSIRNGDFPPTGADYDFPYDISDHNRKSWEDENVDDRARVNVTRFTP